VPLLPRRPGVCSADVVPFTARSRKGQPMRENLAKLGTVAIELILLVAALFLII
jgi:hypothetical protein